MGYDLPGDAAGVCAQRAASVTDALGKVCAELNGFGRNPVIPGDA